MRPFDDRSAAPVDRPAPEGPPPAGIEVRCERGIWLPESGWWLDPADVRPRAFVSHAHSDHFARHGEILCSRPTLALIEARYGAARAGRRVRAFEFGETFPLGGGFTGRLLPAGHIFGSAQIRIERERDGASLLYTGDFKLRLGLSAEPAEIEPSDLLIMETTYGLPRYCFPPTSEVIERVVRFAVEALEDGEVPVLFGYSLGKAQEILSALAGAGLPVMLHSSVHRMTEVYERLRPGLFPAYREFKESEVAGHVVIFPPSGARAQAIRRLRRRRTAMLTGWALNPGARFRYQVDAVFPLSDHADYPDLLAMVERVRPARVLTLHGFAGEFAADLRRRGVEAWSATAADQLELNLESRGSGARSACDAVAGDALAAAGVVPSVLPDAALPPRPDFGFGAFGAVCDRIAASTGRRGKVAMLAGFLASLGSPGDLERAARFLAGRPLPRRESGAGALQVGWALIRRALLEASRLDAGRYRAISAEVADSGRTAYLVLAEGWVRRAGDRPAAEGMALGDVEAFFRRLRDARGGPAARLALLAETFERMHPADAAYLVRLLTGDLRIGLREGLVEEAVAEAFHAPPEAVREAAMLLGDIGRTAALAAAGRLGEAGLTPFVPVQAMLASPEESPGAIWRRLGSEGTADERPDGPRGVWLEDKFDGIRAQVHKVGRRVEIFSRDLRRLTGEFGDLAEAVRAIDGDVVLDGEIIAHADGRRLTFFDLQKRINRRHDGDLFLGAGVPVRFVAFDLLWRNGESLLDRPLRERRRALDAIGPCGGIVRIDVTEADGPAAIERAFAEARARGNEGLIAKDPGAAYRPGRRGKAWLKLKKAFTTLDVVVVRAQRGHGRRSHVLSDYTFAVRDERDDSLRVIGKAYSGLTDAEIEELTGHFLSRTLSRRRGAVEVEPDVVLEVAFDAIQPSRRHDSGLALRFPRIRAIRRDKSAGEIDTLQYAERLAAASARGGPAPSDEG